MEQFAGSSVVISGGSSGIGLTTALAFQEAGAKVMIADVKPPAGGNESLGFTKLDVGDEKAWQELMIDFVPDVLVNNAGIPLGPHQLAQDPESCLLEDWQTVQRVNLEGVFLGCKHAIKVMKVKASGGVIVNIASISGKMGTPWASPYGATKAAVINHTKAVALYCGSKGYPIRCNAVLPGPIRTPIWDPMLGRWQSQDEAEKALAKGVPMRRFGDPEEVSKLILFLASSSSSYCNGGEYTVDGGHLGGYFVP